MKVREIQRKNPELFAIQWTGKNLLAVVEFIKQHGDANTPGITVHAGSPILALVNMCGVPSKHVPPKHYIVRYGIEFQVFEPALFRRRFKTLSK